MDTETLEPNKWVFELDKFREFGFDLNPVFLADRAVVPVDFENGVLTVGMSNVEDIETVAAIRFAIGHEVRATSMSDVEIRRRMASLVPASQPTLKLGTGPQANLPDTRRSLTEQIVERLTGTRAAEGTLHAFARLIKVGYSPAEAWDIVVPMLPRHHGINSRTGDAVADLACQLGSAPRLAAALLPVRKDRQARALLTLSRAQNAIQSIRRANSMTMIELGVWGLPALLAWQATAYFVAGLVAALLLAIAVRFRLMAGAAPDNDLVRADVLQIVSVLAREGVPDAIALRTGCTQLAELVPRWGKIPDDRSSLSAALKLSAISTAILARGDLAEATATVAADCLDRAAAAVSRAAVEARAIGVLCLTTALVVLLT